MMKDILTSNDMLKTRFVDGCVLDGRTSTFNEIRERLKVMVTYNS